VVNFRTLSRRCPGHPCCLALEGRLSHLSSNLRRYLVWAHWGRMGTTDDQKPRPVDTDEVVPYRLECDLLSDWGGRHYGNWETVDGEVVMESEIALNWCRWVLQGAGPRDIHRVLEHERAHARGWRHYEGTPDKTPLTTPTR
jgi:hypothetical protein